MAHAHAPRPRAFAAACAHASATRGSEEANALDRRGTVARTHARRRQHVGNRKVNKPGAQLMPWLESGGVDLGPLHAGHPGCIACAVRTQTCAPWLRRRFPAESDSCVSHPSTCAHVHRHGCADVGWTYGLGRRCARIGGTGCLLGKEGLAFRLDLGCASRHHLRRRLPLAPAQAAVGRPIELFALDVACRLGGGQSSADSSLL